MFQTQKEKMKLFKTIPVFILLFAGHLCNTQVAETSTESHTHYTETQKPTGLLGEKGGAKLLQNATEVQKGGRVPGRSLPTLVVAGVSIALVLLCILIVAIFGYAWKKSQEGSMELNPLPYGEAGVSLRTISVPEKQQEWPFERAVQ